MKTEKTFKEYRATQKGLNGMYTLEDPSFVQFTLDSLEPMQQFTVVFMTQGNEQRRYTGHLDPNSTSKGTSVAMMTSEGYKRFSIERVLYIQGEG